MNMARILLVDDDSDIRELGKALITRAGHEVFLASDAMEALQRLQETPIDLLITDANMPRFSGFDLIKTLQGDPKYANLTMAMLTARRERKDIERALALGLHDYIIKPLDPMLFLKKIGDLLERRPPPERAEADFATLKLQSAAKALLPVEIVALSELGITIRSPHAFKGGSRFEIQTDVFTKIGVEAPVMRAQSCTEVSPALFETRVVFVGADEKFLTKVRAWVHSSMAKKRVA
jgi:two-component system chemotaxis response regulator CheY